MTDEMKPNIRYIVTKASEDKTFRTGDKVRLLEDGDILTTHGWIEAEKVASATLGWEIEVDKEWQAARIAKLQAELARIEAAT